MQTAEQICVGACHKRAVCGDWRVMWPAFEQAYAELASPGARAAEPALRRELLFCLLGGHGVTFETSVSALEVIENLDVFSRHHDGDVLHARLIGVLDQPRFEPARKDGSLRRFRFPRRKAMLICQARSWLIGVGSLADAFAARACERERRSWLVGCPGLGPKSASWLLRNTGWATELAILDVHVIRAMTEAGILRERYRPGDYEHIEGLFLQ